MHEPDHRNRSAESFQPICAALSEALESTSSIMPAGPLAQASAYLGESVQPSDEPIEALLLDEKSLSLLRSG